MSAEPLIEETLAEVVKISGLNFEKMDFEKMDLNFKKNQETGLNQKCMEILVQLIHECSKKTGVKDIVAKERFSGWIVPISTLTEKLLQVV